VRKLTIGSLFAGIGGLELGLEWTGGFETIWQIEIDDYAAKVLEKHWPKVRRYRDIRECGKHNLAPVDVICGGFPCQDISIAGQRKGIIDGERSGLWSEFKRLICELRPRYALIENVTPYYATLPKSGMMRNGRLYRQGSLEPDIYDDGYLLWPTPRVADVSGGNRIMGLREAVQIFPTPTKRDWKDGYSTENVPINCLLGRAVQPSQKLGSLNPMWVEWLMGFPLGHTDLNASETP